MTQQSLYKRLGGYDGIATFIGDALPRMQNDPQLGRFWNNRGADGLAREKQLLINFLCAATGGPTHYAGRDMKSSHRGMGISEEDWSLFMDHASASMEFLELAGQERDEVAVLVSTLKPEIVGAA